MADLDLPRGPLTRHLQSIRNLYGEALSAVRAIAGPDQSVREEAMDHHLQAIAAYTADKPRGGPTPPRPDPIQRGETRREGWEFLVVGQDGTVLAGWTDDGHFFAWSPTEVIVRTLSGIIVGLLNGDGTVAVDHG